MMKLSNNGSRKSWSMIQTTVKTSEPLHIVVIIGFTLTLNMKSFYIIAILLLALL